MDLHRDHRVHAGGALDLPERVVQRGYVDEYLGEHRPAGDVDVVALPARPDDVHLLADHDHLEVRYSVLRHVLRDGLHGGRGGVRRVGGGDVVQRAEAVGDGQRAGAPDSLHRAQVERREAHAGGGLLPAASDHSDVLQAQRRKLARQGLPVRGRAYQNDGDVEVARQGGRGHAQLVPLWRHRDRQDAGGAVEKVLCQLDGDLLWPALYLRRGRNPRAGLADAEDVVSAGVVQKAVLGVVRAPVDY